MLNDEVAVIGGGMWGRALAYAFSQKYRVCIFSRRLLKDLKYINYEVRQVDALCALRCKYIVIAIKSGAIREWLEDNIIDSDSIVLVASKGIEVDSGAFICDIVSMYLSNIKVGYLMGPSFAKEVLEGMPCALNIHTKHNIDSISDIFPNFIKIYFDEDVIGGEVAGAYKNIIAIAGGITDGLTLGSNAKASIIARGLVEMARFGAFFGAKNETFLGLSGAGDLFLTANSTLSRNYRVGFDLARGKTLSDILESLEEVAEGIFTTQAVLNLSIKHNIYTPIAREIYEIFNGKQITNSIKKML